MDNEIEYVLTVEDHQVADVLVKINRIGGTLIESGDSSLNGKIKIACKIESSVEREFIEWLQENNINSQI